SHLSCGIEGGESAGYSLPPPTFPARPETQTHNIWVTSPTLYPLGHDSLNSLSSLCLCLFRIISPCRSLCASVQDSCAPIMNCYDQFPKDHLMCISSVACTVCELEEATSSKDLLDLFCKSDFVVKVRLSKLNSSSSVLTMFSLGSWLEVLKHGPLLGGEMRSRLMLWLERDATCVGNLTRNHPDGGAFLLTGTVSGKRLLVSKAFTARKWKSHRCRG
uniref:NTR domain-containing protein n=1 Tax=Sinocyclocheilus anshuiensis TaxID=1608454 RepID=A0A671NPN5_9TELE